MNSELKAAYENLTNEQRERIKAMHTQGKHYATIACKLGLTKSYVHSYVRLLNSGEAQV